MIKFVTGLPGGGKSLYAVMRLIDELRGTERRIVTNLALRLHPWVDGRGVARKGLLRVLKDTYGSDFEAELRIVLLSVEQTEQFFLYGRSQVPAAYQNESGKFVCMPERGVAFFIDELHEFMPAKDWEKHAGLTLSWMTQHRRAGDDAWVISQHPLLVANNFRRLCQECISMQNRKFRRFFAWRQPDVLSFSVYQSTPPKDSEPAMYSDYIKGSRARIYECYDTAAGVGVTGAAADVQTKPTGLPFWTMWVALGVILLLCAGLWAGCTKMISAAIRGHALPSVHGSVAVPVAVLPPKPVGFVTGPMVHQSVPPIFRETNGVCMVTHGTAGWVVLWADGTTSQPILEPKRVGRDWVIDGVAYPSQLLQKRADGKP